MVWPRRVAELKEAVRKMTSEHEVRHHKR